LLLHDTDYPSPSDRIGRPQTWAYLDFKRQGQSGIKALHIDIESIRAATATNERLLSRDLLLLDSQDPKFHAYQNMLAATARTRLALNSFNEYKKPKTKRKVQFTAKRNLASARGAYLAKKIAVALKRRKMLTGPLHK
jgi:hypothetical protein